MLVMTLVPLLAPRVRAAPTTITLLDPSNGFVGTTVKVEGSIDTPNGTYIIRWNSARNITMGSASGNNVSTSFIVPPTAGAPLGLDITVELIDNSTQTVGTAYFKLYTKYHIKAEKPSPPNQLQEGETTKIWVNVTGGEANTVYAANISATDPSGKNYTLLVSLSNSTKTGYGEANMTYPNDFGTSAHTNNTGTYYVSFNKTLATDNFRVGLTDKLVYHPNETILIRGAGFGYSEIVTADIKVGGLPVATFPKNLTTTGGVVTLEWTIPSNVTPGIYNLTLTNATSPGTVKTPPDTQSFEILGVLCQIQTVNLANQPVTGVVVKVYNATTNTYLNVSGETNSSGWIRFLLNSANYTFKAFWKDVEVGVLSNKNVSQTPLLTFTLQLTNLQIVVEDEMGDRLSFIDLTLETKYEVESFRTNATGTWEIYNLFTNMSYSVEARRYNLLIPGTPIKNLTVSLPWNNATIVVPTYTLFVQVRDSYDANASGLNVRAYEWSSGIGEPFQSKLTDSSGKVTLSLTFGRYRLRLYSDTVFLNEVTVDIVQNQSSLVVHSDVYNVDLSVLVVDYFGQPIPNAFVEFQRKVNSDYQTAKTQTTGADGIARFNGITGGDSRVYVSVAGSPSETQYLYLTGPTRNVVFKMDGYVAVAGYVLETGQFVTIVVLLIVVVAFIIASNYKRLTRRLQRRGK